MLAFRETLWFCRVFLPFALAYFFSYLLRNINVIATPRLVLAFNLDAGQIGSLTALSAPAPFVTEIDATHENATVLRSVLALALVE